MLAERAGHSKASMTLDTYSHVLNPGKVPDERLQALLDACNGLSWCGPGVA